ncbi:MAG: excinuclease ABC subunit UvrC [Deltaproteobacteria bacterium]|nr:excinuclease ABC subunit UvrC [Deltaproteobacteria bacterium]
MNAALAEKLEHLPTSPGVYLMKDKQGRVIYVGKALNLRNRVRSYFQARSGDTRAFVAFLDRLLGDLEVVVVSNEKEALLLENELIKKHQPRFNVLLRDDKNFICLRLDLSQPYPRLEIQRRIADDGARYFGPYHSAQSIRHTLRLVNRGFHLRSCRDRAFERRMAGKERPSLLCQLNQCPCWTKLTAEQYRPAVDEAVLFLEGKHTELVDHLRARMKDASSKMEFETAARYRDHVIAIERSLEKQRLITSDFVDRDVFGLARDLDRILIYVLFIRGGRLAEHRAFPFSGQEFPDEELLGSFVDLYYDGGNLIPDEVLLPFELEDLAAKAEWLREKKGKKVEVYAPRKGEKLRLVEMARQNAEQQLGETKRTAEEKESTLLKLQKQLSLSKLPRRIECYDISLFQGASAVGSGVSFLDGEPDKSNYRRYKVKTVEGTDDFAMLYEVLTRRAKRGLESRDLPDLIVIDGGKGQLGSAVAAFKDAGVSGVDLCSLAKSRLVDEDELSRGRGYAGARRAREHQVSQDAAEAPRSPERVFLPNVKDPIVLRQSSPELLLLARIRDEAHRFAITYHRQTRGKRSFASELEAIPGIGATRRKQLLKHFGSVRRIREATSDQLAEQLGPAAGARLFAHLHPPERSPADPAAPPDPDATG